MKKSIDLDFKKAQEECPWPRNSDELFKADIDWWNNACLNFLNDHWEGYVIGYKRAGDLLINQVIDSNKYQDTLVDTVKTFL